MNTHEQIIALLNGDLKNDSDVADLLHILSVSYEKRRTLLKQLQMSRMLNGSARTITPSHAADARLWQSIAAEKAATPSPLPLVERDSFWRRFFSLPAALLLLLLVGISTMMGYWLRPVTETPRAYDAPSGTMSSQMRGQIQALTETTDSLQGLLVTAHDSLALLRTQNSMASGHTPSSQNRVTIFPERRSAAREILRAPTAETEELAIPIPKHDRSPSDPMLQAMALRDAPVSLSPLSRPALSSRGEHIPWEDAGERSDKTRWRAGLRKYMRASFPQMTDLAIQQPPTSDQEIHINYKLLGTERTDFELGLAAGQMTFAQRFHTMPSSGTQDTIVEQSPPLLYGRAFIGSPLINIGSFSTVLELSAGAASVGPLGMVGLSLEYRPVDLFAVEVGASGWMLATQFRGNTYTSFNLNAHWGLTIGF